MIKIEIKDQSVARREITRKSDGKIITFYEQQAWAYTYSKGGNLNPYPEAITLNLDAMQQPYAPGYYIISPESIRVNRFKQLEIAFMTIKPLERPIERPTTSTAKAVA